MKHLVFGLAATAALIGVAAAQSRPGAANAIHARQAHYKQIGAAMKAINDQLRAGEPALPVIRRNAGLIAGLAPRVSGWFPHGTGAEARVRTRALPEIWSDPAGFRAAAVNFILASRRFDAAARRGDLAAIRADARGLGNACRDCHDHYRGPEQ